MAFPYSGTPAGNAASLHSEDVMQGRSASRAPAHSSALQADGAATSSWPVGGPAFAASSSAVSWSAIFAGAAVASALSLILLILGTGLGLSSVSPWASAGIGAAAFGVSTILWISFTQIIASGMGGYLAGRLRTKYVSVHNDEVYFRDTAHGFLTWAVASLVTASVLASAVGGIVGMGASAAGSMTSGVASGIATAGGAAIASTAASPSMETNANTNTNPADPLSYLVDSMLRKSGSGVPVAATAAPDSSPVATTAEITRIFLNSIKQSALPPDDAKYVAAAVVTRTGVTPDEAEGRVNATFERLHIKLRNAEASARQTADTARKATAYGALWLFVSLLIGAFFASWGATFGGRHRDI